jgi:hypothetical protein
MATLSIVGILSLVSLTSIASAADHPVKSQIVNTVVIMPEGTNFCADVFTTARSPNTFVGFSIDPATADMVRSGDFIADSAKGLHRLQISGTQMSLQNFLFGDAIGGVLTENAVTMLAQNAMCMTSGTLAVIDITNGQSVGNATVVLSQFPATFGTTDTGIQMRTLSAHDLVIFTMNERTDSARAGALKDLTDQSITTANCTSTTAELATS